MGKINVFDEAQRAALIKKNGLWRYRDRRGYSQKWVAALLGHKDATNIGKYELGKRLPSLETAFRLEIILETSAVSLYRALYDELEQEINTRRDMLLS